MAFILGMFTGAIALFIVLAFAGEIEIATEYEVEPLIDKAHREQAEERENERKQR